MKITTVFQFLILSIVFAGGVFAQSDFEVTKALAEKGDAKQQFGLGLLYYLGEGVPKDFSESLKWWKLSANQGNVDGMTGLQIIFSEGSPFENVRERLRWVKLSAEKGYAPSANLLASMYETGDGVPQNYMRAYVWYSVFAAQGGIFAPGDRDRIGSTLSPQDLSKAQALATKCFESNYKDCE